MWSAVNSAPPPNAPRLARIWLNSPISVELGVLGRHDVVRQRHAEDRREAEVAGEVADRNPSVGDVALTRQRVRGRRRGRSSG